MFIKTVNPIYGENKDCLRAESINECSGVRVERKSDNTMIYLEGSKGLQSLSLSKGDDVAVFLMNENGRTVEKLYHPYDLSQ